MHIAPCSYLRGAVDIIVRNIHAADESNAVVDDNNLSVVTMHHVVNPRETDRVEHLYLDTMLTHMLEMFFLQRAVITLVSKGVEQCTHLHAAVSLLFKEMEESITDAVITEIEVFEVDAIAGIADSLKLCCKFFPAVGEKMHMVVMRECDTITAQLLHNQRVAGLCAA